MDTTDRTLACICVLLLLISGTAGCISFRDNMGPDVRMPPGRFRDHMRTFVENIHAYASAQDSDFILIPQNGHPLLTVNGSSDGELSSTYIQAIDGVGREDLFYGYTSDNVATPADVTGSMLSFMDIAKAQGLRVLAIDYCSDQSKMDDSYSKAASHGYISFAADRRNVDDIPVYPARPYNVNDDNVTSLGQARNVLYLLNPEKFPTKDEYLAALRATDHDVLIIDAYFQDELLTPSDVSSLKSKASGGSRLVISYMSIGEAEDYRYYWDSSWDKDKPSWLDKENPNWKGNYKVRYWHSGWHSVIYGNDGSYTHKLLEAGFDGAYLDIIDAYEYYE